MFPSVLFRFVPGVMLGIELWDDMPAFQLNLFIIEIVFIFGEQDE